MNSKQQQKWIQKSLVELDKKPDSPVFALLAEAFRKRGKLELALKICRRGLKYNPRFVKGHTTLGCIYLDLKNDELAAASFQKALDLEPENLLALRCLGRLHIRLRNIEQALMVYKMLVLFAPDDFAIQKIVQKLQNLSYQRYEYFASQSLQETAFNLHQRQLEKRPSLYPIRQQKTQASKAPVFSKNRSKLSETLSIEKTLNQWSKTQALEDKHFPMTAQAKKEKKLQQLESLMQKF